MTLLKHKRKEVFSTAIMLTIFVMGQIVGSSVNLVSANDLTIADISSEDLILSIKDATNTLTSLFNEREGIFLWNVQNPQNLSRYGDNSDLTNGQESLENLDYKYWLEGLSQDVSMQYLLLKNYVDLSMQFVGNQPEENVVFYREWMFLTERIINSLYYDIANSDSLMNILQLLSKNGDVFGEFWNSLIRPKYNSLVGEILSLLPDTLVLGSQILRAAEFMPNYFSRWEELRLITLSEVVSDWWNTINRYALHDPDFTIAAIGNSKLYQNYDTWITWNEFKKLVRSEEFSATNIFENNHLELQRYIYTSPEIASQYLSYIRKVAIEHSFLWDSDVIHNIPINDVELEAIFNSITQDYADHIVYIRNKPVYVFDPRYEDVSWTSLQVSFTGYTYYFADYLIDDQGSPNDLYQYRVIDSPLKITNCRTYQGAGDIRGLMDIFKVLSNGFTFGDRVSSIEKAAMNILFEIIDAQRSDSGYILGPYFGSSLDESVISNPLINDAELLYPEILPEGLRVFTGSMTIFDFLIDVHTDIEKFGYDESLISLKHRLTSTLESLTKLLESQINPTTYGINKQSIIGNTYEIYGENEQPILYNTKNINIQIDVEISNIPEWINSYNSLTNVGLTNVYQWDYLELFKKVFLITKDTSLTQPIFNALKLFNDDFSIDNQYQLLSICEVKDAIARTFFKEERMGNLVEMTDFTGIYGDIIPFNYRDDVSPVTSAFAAETPQKVAAMILSILPYIPIEEFLNNPINQVVIAGFVFGVILTIAVVYIKRPRYQ